jgi:hypothetical protein
MRRLVDLRVLFVVVAVLEFAYFLASLTPPRLVTSVTGWVLNADGHWIVKLLGVALLTQAAVAWTFRHTPHLGVAKVLAFYQFASATADWIMWIAMKDAGIFSTPLARVTVLAAIVSHYALGILLALGIARASRLRLAAAAPIGSA